MLRNKILAGAFVLALGAGVAAVTSPDVGFGDVPAIDLDDELIRRLDVSDDVDDDKGMTTVTETTRAVTTAPVAATTPATATAPAATTAPAGQQHGDGDSPAATTAPAAATTPVTATTPRRRRHRRRQQHRRWRRWRHRHRWRRNRRERHVARRSPRPQKARTPLRRRPSLFGLLRSSTVMRRVGLPGTMRSTRTRAIPGRSAGPSTLMV